MKFDLSLFTEICIEATCKAADSINHFFGLPPDKIGVSLKQDETLVTKADRLSEDIIINIINKNFPSLPLLVEESGIIGNNSNDLICIVDPLDGTSSFSHGIPTYAILISLVEKTAHESCVLSCIINEPQTGRVWYAIKGESSFLLNYNKYQKSYSAPISISVSTKNQFNEKNSMIIYDAALKFRNVVPQIEDKKKALNAILPIFRRARMIGSLALQFAYVASGFAEATVADAVGGPYDLCGHLLVDEAGGMTSDIFLKPIDVFTTKVAIATNGQRHIQLSDTLKKIYTSFGDLKNEL